MTTYRYIIDGGHGWLEVPLAKLGELGFVPTRYSYRSDTFAYLEEDCDMPAFLHIHPEGSSVVDMTLEYDGTLCFVRDFPHFDTREDVGTYYDVREAMYESYRLAK